MARSSGRRELKSEINIVPLLDVLLVLVLILWRQRRLSPRALRLIYPTQRIQNGKHQRQPTGYR